MKETTIIQTTAESPLRKLFFIFGGTALLVTLITAITSIADHPIEFICSIYFYPVIVVGAIALPIVLRKKKVRIFFRILSCVPFIAIILVLEGFRRRHNIDLFPELDASAKWLLIISLFIAVVFFIIGLIYNRKYLLTVTNVRVSVEYKKSRLDLPIRMITAVGYGPYCRLTVTTAGGHINLLFVKNRDEAYSALSDLLAGGQGGAKTQKAPDPDELTYM